MTDRARAPEDVTSAPKKVGRAAFQSPDNAAFQSYMEQGPSQTGGVSPLNVDQKIVPSGTPTFESVMGQMKTAQNTLTSLQGQLNTPNLKFKRSEESLLNTKLTDASTNMREVAQRTGLNPEEVNIPSGASPLARLLGYVNEGQKQLVDSQNKLQELSASGSLKPEELIIIQQKMAQAQQALEYSSLIVSKVVDFIRQTMNIQV